MVRTIEHGLVGDYVSIKVCGIVEGARFSVRPIDSAGGVRWGKCITEAANVQSVTTIVEDDSRELNCAADWMTSGFDMLVGFLKWWRVTLVVVCWIEWGSRLVVELFRYSGVQECYVKNSVK